MSLNWDISKIKNADDLCWLPAGPGEKDEDRKMNPITNALIWTTMSVGMGAVTEKNHLEFFARCELVSKLSGAPLTKVEGGKRVDINFTLEDIKAHIGISTNVSDETQGKWLTRIGKNFIEGTIRAKRK
jgi:hypothetical protein